MRPISSSEPSFPSISEMARSVRPPGIRWIAALTLLSPGCAGYVSPQVTADWKSHTRVPLPVLQRGYEVHQLKCAKCHPFENPADYGEAEWRDEIMPVMARKSKLNDADADAVLAYVLAARQVPVADSARSAHP